MQADEVPHSSGGLKDRDSSALIVASPLEESVKHHQDVAQSTWALFKLTGHECACSSHFLPTFKHIEG
jgi:hypothetical protein